MPLSKQVRQKARTLAVQVLYHYGKTNSFPEESLISDIFEESDVEAIALHQVFISACQKHLAEIDQAIARNLKTSWKQKRLHPILNAILRAGVSELMFFPESGHRVILSEIFSLCKKLAGRESVDLCNGILHNIWKNLPSTPQNSTDILPKKMATRQKKQLYFAYGSNLSQVQMNVRCPDNIPLTQAKLEGYRLGFSPYSERWKGGGATLYPGKKSFVTGGMYELSEADVKLLDYYEGVPNIYQRQIVEVETSSSERKEVLVYICSQSKLNYPSEKYLCVILEGLRDFELSTKPLRTTLENIFYAGSHVFIDDSIDPGSLPSLIMQNHLEIVPAIYKPRQKEPEISGNIYVFEDCKPLWQYLSQLHTPQRENLQERQSDFNLCRSHSGESFAAWIYCSS